MNAPKQTIVLIHGLWVTPLSWGKFQRRYEDMGHRVLAPAWPGIRGTVEDMRRDASSLHGVGIAEVVAHYSAVIRALPEPPVLMGHSFGGLITQLLLDRGLGAAGVAIDSVPPKGILLLPWSTYRSLLPAFVRPSVPRGSFLFNPQQFRRVFANTLSPESAREAWLEHAIPAPGRAIFQAALSNLVPRSPAFVHFANPRRAPLLIIGGERDVIMPAALSRKIHRRHRVSPAVTDHREFAGRSHYLIAEPGWEEVADFALEWAVAHAALPAAGGSL